MKPLLSFMVAFALVTYAVAQQPDQPPAHAPERCNRAGGFDDQGPIHVCTCRPMAHSDGEECVIDVEDKACRAWCDRSKCGCAITCDLPPATPPTDPHHH